ncbi:3-deoxy-D-manno-octulosonic-acid transferase [Flavobacterium sp. SORGH_AS 622]|nr:3-deoxy-D-manno-octulosonic-acid transferase [Flavobacterium sp. SORGH_AS_0622]
MLGGGFGNPGIHNILEPAAFGIPIVIGPNYSNFAEAVSLVELQGCMVISNTVELKKTFDQLLSDNELFTKKSSICKSFIQDNKGATETIIKTIS